MVDKNKFSEQLVSMKDYVALVTVNAKKYQQINVDIIKNLTDKGVPGVYVTLNKPFNTIKKFFEEKKVDLRLVLFIDVVTVVSKGEIKKTKACLFIGSPENLSDISIAIDQAVTAIPSKDKFLFFDSLNTLLVYNDVRVVAQFIHFLANKMRTWKIRGIIISLKKESDKELIDELSQICDLTADLR